LTTTEAELLERVRTYEAEALAEIYDRFADTIYRYLYRYLGDAAQAEDLTSEVFVRLLQALNTRRAPRERLQGWLYRVAHNLAMDWFRQGGEAIALPLEEEWVADSEPPPALVEKRQTQAQLRAAVHQLTPDQQQVVLLRFVEGLKIEEVSRLLDKSEGAVKVLQHRAIRRLHKLLAREE
jgi:RNA polymerase sigma-70 factor (ECF subfamily)